MRGQGKRRGKRKGYHIGKMIVRGRGIFKRDMGGYLGKGGRLKKGVGGGKGTGRVVKLEHENFGEIVGGVGSVAEVERSCAVGLAGGGVDSSTGVV